MQHNAAFSLVRLSGPAVAVKGSLRRASPALDRAHRTTPNPLKFQKRLEFAKLPRSMWRKVKERIQRCIEDVQSDEVVRPYRLAYPRMDCGFVFIPAPSEIVGSHDWKAIRLRSLQNFMTAHKYD